MGEDALFRAAPAAERVDRQVEALLAVYHRRSGLTHLLAQPLPELLTAMGEEPCTADMLLARLGVDRTPDSLAAVTAHLAELESIGLVARG